ncbi:glycoside hydrolase family 13 protein [Flavobacteriaceae bacterium]|nr:glycoside hydrolase family 13 protein [Flavobacteriaceae bacterium]MDB9954535.1 glycoside hydrolase family 13 protein [Flavobacteriaceae bacterium]
MKKIFKIGLMCSVIYVTSCSNLPSTNGTDLSSSSLTHNDINRIEPPNWWVGFESKNLQLLINHPNISEAIPQIDYKGVSIHKVHKADSPNYLFIDLIIDESTLPGVFDIVFNQSNKEGLIQSYELKARTKMAIDYKGFDSSDVIYLITPDRFANGDTSNDIDTSLQETTLDRSDDYARHGGDIKGITNHLDYIEEMGFTAIWSSPLLTNDMPQASYHGYAMTDFYNIDPRFGSLIDYKELAQKADEKGIKLIMDQVANHCGSEHWWMSDLPFKNWVNYQAEFEAKAPTIYSNHRRTSNQDRYASKQDTKGLTDGWFVSSMPDLNQRNPFMATYIIQNSIWWIEAFDLGGIRQDTYPYPDKNFMRAWAGAIMNEYPNFSIVGEEWSYNPLLIGYWQKGANNKDGYDSNLKSSMDFAMQKQIVDGLKEPETWDLGLVKMYEGLANDFHYASPKDLMIFTDNHDMSRIFTQFDGDMSNTKMALSYLLMLPRIPQIYYGTEIVMDDFEKPGDHGLIRTDFPGGWKGDATNGFTGNGLSEPQKEMQLYLKKLLNYRKNSLAIHKGTTIHFAPFIGTYFLFRSFEDETVVIIINKNESPITIDLKRYSEMGLNGTTLRNVINDDLIEWDNKIQLTSKGCLVLTTKKSNE